MKADGLVYHAHGVPNAMSDSDFIKTLTIPASLGSTDPPWTCIPFARVKDNDRSKKTLVVKALTEPTKHTFRIEYLGRNYAIHLVLQAHKKDILDKAADRLAAEEDKYCSTTHNDAHYLPPQPKRAAKPSKRDTMETDNEEAELEAVMCLRRCSLFGIIASKKRRLPNIA